jgi:hypothetical protein
MPNGSRLVFLCDAWDLRRPNDVWWVYEDDGICLALLNPHIEADADDETGSLTHYPVHEGIAMLPEFVAGRWPPPRLAPTVCDLAGDEYGDEAYEALREHDWRT